MATIEERLTAALEQIAVLTARNNTQQPHQEIAYIPEFNGDPNKLTHFISIVDTHLGNTDQNRKAIIWSAINNLKISGRAKELILNNDVTSWDAAKLLFAQHFRPLLNLKDITRKINLFKVGSIAELCSRLEQIIGEINKFVLYETNKESARQLLYNTLILKIKDLVTGSLARELKNVYDLNIMKQILYTYVGFDENLDRSFHQPKPHNPNKPKPTPTQNPSYQPDNSDRIRNYSQNHPHQTNNLGRYRTFNSGSDRFRSRENNYGRFRSPNRNNNFNPSGQLRNSAQNPQPMEVDQIQQVEETNNNIEEQVFLN